MGQSQEESLLKVNQPSYLEENLLKNDADYSS